MTNKRVLVFAETALALSETFIAAHCRALQRYDYSLAALYSSGDHHPDIKRHLLFPKRPGAWHRMAFRLGQSRQLDSLIARTRPDLIHAHYLTNGAFLLPYAARHDIPLIVTAHGHDATRALRKRSVYDQIYRLQRTRLQRSAALLLPVSNFLRDELVVAGFSPERTLTHYLGIALPSAPPVEPANNPPRIVFVGRLVAKKGLDKVLEAFEQVRSVKTDAQLHIVGDGPLRDLVIAKARAIGGIMWHGAQSPDRTQRIMATARLLALPSRRAPDGDVEGLGLVLLEAQALGIPVVAASTGATAEAVADGESGFTVDPDKTEQLAAAFLKLLGDTELARTMGAKAYHFVRQNFDIAERTQLLEQVYDTVLDQHRAPQATR